jgi:hypothetical protein
MKKNLYEILEVSPTATQEEIKEAMMRLGKKYATKSQTNETVRAYFNQIKEAYKILSSPYRRASYDDFLKLDQKRAKPSLFKRFYRLIKKIVSKSWRTSQFLWQKSKQWISMGWNMGRRYVITGWHQGKQQTIRGFKLGEEKALQGLKATEKQAIEGWRMVAKQRSATKYVTNTLIPGEKIMYQTFTHWFFYFDLGAVIIIILSSYLLIDNPDFIHKDMPTVSLWMPEIISATGLLEASVWHLGLLVLLLIGLLMLWEAFIIKHTTELVITSKRVIAKFGLLNRTIIEIKLRRFESVTIEQSMFGRVFNYGTITITGMGGVKTTVPNVVSPLKFKKILWQVLEYMGYMEYEEDTNC